MNKNKFGPWIQSYKGRKLYPFDPAPEDFDIEEIAHALSLLCRYGGMCLRFYSIAEHSVLVASRAPNDLKLAALLHDAAEGCGLNDMLRPVKKAMPEFQSAEARIMRALANRYQFPYPSAIVSFLDNRIVLDERVQNMAPMTDEWDLGTVEPLGVTLQFWTPEQAEIAFLDAFRHYELAARK